MRDARLEAGSLWEGYTTAHGSKFHIMWKAPSARALTHEGMRGSKRLGSAHEKPHHLSPTFRHF